MLSIPHNVTNKEKNKENIEIQIHLPHCTPL